MKCSGTSGPKMLENPFGELARLGFVVVERGNHQIGDLEPDVGFVLQTQKSFEHGLRDA